MDISCSRPLALPLNTASLSRKFLFVRWRGSKFVDIRIYVPGTFVPMAKTFEVRIMQAGILLRVEEIEEGGYNVYIEEPTDFCDFMEVTQPLRVMRNDAGKLEISDAQDLDFLSYILPYIEAAEFLKPAA